MYFMSEFESKQGHSHGRMINPAQPIAHIICPFKGLFHTAKFQYWKCAWLEDKHLGGSSTGRQAEDKGKVHLYKTMHSLFLQELLSCTSCFVCD